ncbi:MAG: histone deacetylase family protein, partial [Caenispirillum bisanense]|nr:histone deacetylase family protein [Caenispirillum bisanense]MCA1972854.1 histone deacetylase family protein [Caenispirillum sp.]
AVCAAVDAVARGEVRNAFCAVRPPGHHAEREQAMGFCIFNNVAVGAYHARAVHGLKRVAVLDWDVHHGNGTQHIFWEDPDMLYVSTHQWPQWPHTGAPAETGAHNNILNVPLPVRAGSDEFRQVMADQVLPAMREFKPDMIILSCGFDAHANDPMAYLLLQVSDFVWATKEVMALADEVCDGRVVSVLEGGYDIRALAACTVGHVRALMGI